MKDRIAAGIGLCPDLLNHLLERNIGVRQRIQNGYQHEDPDDWLSAGNPWEMVRPNYAVNVGFGGHVSPVEENGRTTWKWFPYKEVVGIPYDMPIVGYGGSCVNILRLWSARACQSFKFDEFNQGGYEAAVASKTEAENLTKVLRLGHHANVVFQSEYLFGTDAIDRLRVRQDYTD